MESAWATSAGISRPVNRRGMAGTWDTRRHRMWRFAGAAQPSMCRTGASDQFLHLRQDFRDDDIDPGGARMETVALVERPVGRHAVEEERIENHAVGGREVRINRVE